MSLLIPAVATALVGATVAAGDAAMGALPPGRLAAIAEGASAGQREALQRYIGNPDRVLGRWLVVRTLTTAMAAVLIGEMPAFHGVGLRPVFAVAGALLLCGTLYEVGAALARARAPLAGPFLLRMLRPLELAVIPFADPISFLGTRIGRLVAREEPKFETRLAETEVEYLVDDAAKTGHLAAEPAEMIRNVLDFKDLVVRDVMVPRIKICGVEIETPLTEVLAMVTREGHSRYPVYATKIDNVVGVLYTKDLFTVIEAGRLGSATLKEIARTPVNFIPETQPVSAVLRDMRSRRHHMAVLVDEYGGVSGVVTLEDIVEEIVGDIRDEYDREDAPIQDLGNGRLLADASVSLTDLSAYLGTEIEGDGDYGSLGGLLTHEAGRVPPSGAHIVASGIEFIVRDSDAKRIVRVEIILPPVSGSMAPDPPSFAP